MAQGIVMSGRFLIACWAELKLIWPILAGLAGAQVVLGVLVGLRENWSFGESIYFSLITGLTIGYGDLVPLRFSTRFLSVFIGFIGILTTGLVAAISVRALQEATASAAAAQAETNDRSGQSTLTRPAVSTPEHPLAAIRIGLTTRPVPAGQPAGQAPDPPAGDAAARAFRSAREVAAAARRAWSREDRS